MSNHLISEAYKRQVGNMARKAVMVLLADKASDDGSGIWASKQRMADEIGATKQTVISTIKGLIAEGLVKEMGQRKSPNGYTVEYCIVVSALIALPLVPSHQSKNLTGQAGSPVKKPDLTGQGIRPKPSETPHNGFTNVKPVRAKGWPVIPDWMPAEPWNGFVQMRKRKGGNPTPRAVGLLIGKLERWRAQGHDPGQILDASTENNWTGLFEPKGSQNGQRNGFSGQASTRDLGMEVAAELSGRGSGGPADDLPRIGPPGRLFG